MRAEGIDRLHKPVVIRITYRFCARRMRLTSDENKSDTNDRLQFGLYPIIPALFRLYLVVGLMTSVN